MFLVQAKGSTSRARFDAMHADASPGNPELERQAHRLRAVEEFFTRLYRRHKLLSGGAWSGRARRPTGGPTPKALGRGEELAGWPTARSIAPSPKPRG